MTDEKLINFLSRVPHANWRDPPKVWNDQIRHSMAESLITVGWGGILKLTESGRAAVREAAIHRPGA
jgi:hypothetical protein